MTKRTAKISGTLLLIVGSVLAVAGIMGTRSVADNASAALLGHLTANTMGLLIAGLGIVATGLVVMYRAGSRTDQ